MKEIKGLVGWLSGQRHSKCENLSSILRTHMVDRENRESLSDLHPLPHKLNVKAQGREQVSYGGWRTHEKRMNSHPGETLYNCQPLQHKSRHIPTLTFFLLLYYFCPKDFVCVCVGKGVYICTYTCLKR